VRIAVLGGSSGWHVSDLLRAGREAGVELETAAFQGLEARLAAPGSGRAGVRARGERGRIDLAEAEAVIVRSMPPGTLEQVIFRMDALHRLESLGVRVLNRPRALEAAIDKYLAAARMEEAGLPVPPAAVCERADDARAAFEELGGDVVVKPIFGSEGRGIRRIASAGAADAIFRDLEAAGSAILIQRYIDHPTGDLRLFVLGGEVLCGIRRMATEASGGWITNVARGGRAEPLAVAPGTESLAVRAAAAVGAEAAGVDILPDRDGRPWLLEVNAVPGWRALAAVTGVDVAAEVIRYLLRTGGEGP
jgi:ribosomal protein S6--L-glutamate ligase